MTPLLRVTLAFAFGLLVGLRWAPHNGAVVTLVLTATLLFVLRRQWLWVAVAFGLIGVVLGGQRAQQLTTDCRAQLSDSALVRLRGIALTLPAEGQALAVRAWQLAATNGISCNDVVVRVLLPRAAHQRVRAAVLGTGEGLVLSGRWVRHPARNGWPRRAEFAGAVLVDQVAMSRDIRAGPLTRFRIGQQNALHEIAPREWPLAESLLLAQRSGLTAETRTTWVNAGLVHMLAISGMHVGMIAVGVLGMANLLGVAPSRGRRAALLVSAAYVIFLGAPFAALRALLQAALVLGAMELQRPAEPFTLMSAAALVIMLIDPLAAIDAGFHLSFAGIIGLMMWRRTLFVALPAKLPHYLRDGLASGVAASAFTTPIAALHFGQAAWIGIPATIVATPVMGIAIALLVSAALLHALFGRLPAMLIALTELPLSALDVIAGSAARFPGGHSFLAVETVLVLMAALAVVIIVRRRISERSVLPPPSHAPATVHEQHAGRARRARLRFAIAAAIGLVILSWAPGLLRRANDHVEIHAINVGQGDAFAVRTPRGRWFLIDAGPRTPRSDAGRERVTPFLQRRGVQRLEMLILTHPDADHIGGAAAVLEAFDVGAVIDPGLPAGKDMYIDLLAAARTERVRWMAGRAGIRFSADGVEFEFLYPERELDALRDANDNSVVFRLVFGTFTALFLGDAPASVEEELVARHGGRMRTTVLKVGHHGSATSTSDALLAVARPTLALISVGERNRYGHPAPIVMQRLAEHEVRVLRTDQLGHVTVRAQRNGSVEAHARR